MFYICPTVTNICHLWNGRYVFLSKRKGTKACVPGGLHSVPHCTCVLSYDSCTAWFLCVCDPHITSTEALIWRAVFCVMV